MPENQLSVRLQGEPVGILEQDMQGKKQFIYNSEASQAVSVGMPLRKEPYNDFQCEAFFGGFLPESEIAKQIIGKKYSISPSNTFALLKAIGFDCAGAISFQAMEEPVLLQKSVPLEGKVINEKDLYRHIKELPKKPLFLDVEGIRLSLAGVQDKAAVCLIDNQVAFPINGCPTSHLLKPASMHFEGLSENEYFILKIAKKIGLPVPEITYKKIKDITYLLIARYDRRIKNGYIERIHQEDFCQALGVPAFKKYQNEGGPGFEECFKLLKSTTQPVIGINLMVTAVVFNYLIGNMDAHGKNFSLLHQNGKQIILAPFYDMVCTRAYDNLNEKMAMKIGSKYDADNIFPRHWEQLAKAISYRYVALKKIILTLVEKIILAMQEEKQNMIYQGIIHPIIPKIITFIEKNIEKTIKRFD